MRSLAKKQGWETQGRQRRAHRQVQCTERRTLTMERLRSEAAYHIRVRHFRALTGRPYESSIPKLVEK
jgi:hypothetical protein